MGDYEYKQGLTRGASGKATSKGMFQGHFDNKKAAKDRSEGYRAGLRIHEAKSEKKRGR